MEAAAKRLKGASAAEGGRVETVGDEYRARVRYANTSGGHSQIYGPCRADARRAQADLESMRAKAAHQPARGAYFEAMAKEAHRIQAHAAYEVQVAMAMGKEKHGRQHMHADVDSESDQGIDYAAAYEEPFPDYDAADPANLERLYTAPPRKKSKKAKPPANDIEATRMLADFSPIRSSIDDLRVLLEARADPNATVGVGNISPLRNVMCFARPCDVREMRLLLLDHGAFESRAEKQRWSVRETCDMMEASWLADFHRDDRVRIMISCSEVPLRLSSAAGRARPARAFSFAAAELALCGYYGDPRRYKR